MLSVLIIIIIHNLCVVLLSGVHKLNALYNILKDLDQSPEMVFYYSGLKKKKKKILIDKCYKSGLLLVGPPKGCLLFAVACYLHGKHISVSMIKYVLSRTVTNRTSGKALAHATVFSLNAQFPPPSPPPPPPPHSSPPSRPQLLFLSMVHCLHPQSLLSSFCPLPSTPRSPVPSLCPLTPYLQTPHSSFCPLTSIYRSFTSAFAPWPPPTDPSS